MAISSTGLGSGLDVNSIVTQLMAVERKPIDQLQSQASTLQTQLSSFGKLQSSMSTLRDAALKLTRPDTWSVTTATSSDTSSVSATPGTATPAGSYSINVQSLAAGQMVSSTAFAASTDAVGTGTLHIQLGTYSTSPAGFTPTAGSNTVDIAIDATTNTLEGVRDKINAANSGVTASIVNDATGARIVMRSSATGAENGFQVTATDDDGANTDASGLSRLSFDANSPSQMTRTQSAGNAQATINGLAIASSTNVLTGVIDGLSLTLSKVTTSPVNVSVNQDNDTIKKSINAFVDSYNALNSMLRDQTKYDDATKTGGPLQGDSSAVGLQMQLRSLLSATSGGSSVFQRLADVGLDPQADGSLKVTTSKLDAGLANLPELKTLFANDDPLVSDNVGLARRISNFGDQQLDTDGTFATRTDGLQQRITRNQDMQSAMEVRATATEARLRAQYSALDTRMASLNSLSAYVTQQVNAMNKA